MDATLAALASPPRPMTRIVNDIEHLRVHMVGIGGCGMSGLAALLKRRGTQVSGSDRAPSAVLEQLADLGVAVVTQQSATSMPLDAEVVVISAAIPPDHPERQAAVARGLPVIKYAELLGLLMQRYAGIAISGTHGKSTTTAWLTYVLRLGGLDPSFVVGAHVPQLGGGSAAGSGRHFVVEACEYDRSFLNLHPRLATILNIEEDHLDCYADIKAIEEAFVAFARRVPADGLIILNAGDARCRRVAQQVPVRVETYGEAEDATWRATNVSLVGGRYAFDVRHRLETGATEMLGHVTLGIAGRHNVDNALAVIANARHAGVAWEHIVKGLAEFHGAGRRLELLADVNGIRVADDYAHHPTEIQATLRAARERFTPKRLICVFQPHQHSRTRFLLADFAQSFDDADLIFVPDIYFVRDSEREKSLVNAHDLRREIKRRGGEVCPGLAFDEIEEIIGQTMRPGDVILTMGAGDVWKVAHALVRRLGGNLPA